MCRGGKRGTIVEIKFLYLSVKREGRPCVLVPVGNCCLLPSKGKALMLCGAIHQITHPRTPKRS